MTRVRILEIAERKEVGVPTENPLELQEMKLGELFRKLGKKPWGQLGFSGRRL